MKPASMYTVFTLKTFLITCMIIGFAGFAVCKAQASVIGKWREVSTKQFFNDAYAKKTGRSVVERQVPANSNFIWEFKPDHTYVISDGQGKDDITTGEWSVSGNQLIMKAAAQLRKGQGSEIYTFSIIGNTMTRTMIIQPPYNDTVFKLEETSVRM